MHIFHVSGEISERRYAGKRQTPFSFVGLNSSSFISEVDQSMTSKVFSMMFLQISTSSSKYRFTRTPTRSCSFFLPSPYSFVSNLCAIDPAVLIRENTR